MNPAKTPKPSPYFTDFKIFWLIETGGGASSTITVAIALISSAGISSGVSSTISSVSFSITCFSTATSVFSTVVTSEIGVGIESPPLQLFNISSEETPVASALA